MLKKFYFTFFNLIFLFVSAQNDYTYDAVGNLTSDANKGISNIEYTLCISNGNIGQSFYLPKKIVFESGDYITYLYDALGTKLEKRVYKDDKLIKLIEYQGVYTYVNGELKYKNHNEGFIKYDYDEAGNQTATYVYHFLDHQNNVRLLYTDLNKDGKVTQEEVLAEYNYYPFGLRHEGYNNVEHELLANSEYKKGYQQQELDDDLGLGWYGFKYRNYDPAIARFTTVDPLAEEYSYQSPYNFSENVVIAGIELEGLEFVIPPALLGTSNISPPSLALSNSSWLTSGTRIATYSQADKIIKTGVEGGSKISENVVRTAENTTSKSELLRNNQQRGSQVETEQLQEMGLEKNTQKVEFTDPKTGNTHRTIPDAIKEDGGTVEIKNVKSQSFTRQLRGQNEISKSNGAEALLRINKDANLSKPLKDSNIKIEYYNQSVPVTTDGGLQAQKEKLQSSNLD